MTTVFVWKKQNHIHLDKTTYTKKIFRIIIQSFKQIILLHKSAVLVLYHGYKIYSSHYIQRHVISPKYVNTYSNEITVLQNNLRNPHC